MKKKPRSWPVALAAFRATLDRTQEQMADFLEVSRRIYGYWERGQRSIPPLTEAGLVCLIKKHAPKALVHVPAEVLEKVQ